MMYDSTNPFLNGNYAPWREEGDEFDLLVNGEIPKDLDGSLYRIGQPALSAQGPLPLVRWRRDDSRLHPARRQGHLSQSLREDRRARIRDARGQVAVRRAGRMPKDIEPRGPFKNAANTNIIGYANRLLALWEGGLPHELEPVTLETVGPYSFCDRLDGPMTAHPKFDPKTGELLFFGYQPFPPFVTWHRADAKGNLVESHPIDTGLPVMMHDFVTTENYAIFFVCPSVFRLEECRGGQAAAGMGTAAWHPHRRHEPQEPRSEMVRDDTFYVPFQRTEDGNSVVVDFCRMASLDMTGDGPSGHPQPYRFALDMKEGGVKQTQIDDEVNEFPRIDNRLAGFKHRYGYFAASRATGSATGITKRDYQKNSASNFCSGPTPIRASRILTAAPAQIGRTRRMDTAVLVRNRAEQRSQRTGDQDAADFTASRREGEAIAWRAVGLMVTGWLRPPNP